MTVRSARESITAEIAIYMGEKRQDDLRRLLLRLVAVHGENARSEVDEEIGVALLAEREIALVIVPKESREHGGGKTDRRWICWSSFSFAYC